MAKTVLVVDDEQGILELLEMNLKLQEFRVLTATTGAEALQQMEQAEVHLVLLDVGLPDMDGFDVCKKIRETSNVPVVMVTARAEDKDKILGLETGADDYVVKPFNPKELMARVRANIRRQERQEALPPTTRLNYEEIEIDLLRRRVSVSAEPVELTPREYDLLTYMIISPDVTLTRDQLLAEVWGSEHMDARSVDVHVKYLREKLGKETVGAYIQTVWGKGYRFGKP